MKPLKTLLAGMAIAATFTATPVLSQDVTKLKFMEVIHSLLYSPLYIAKGQGYFEQQGIEFDLVAAQGSDKATAALLGGAADIVLVGPETTVYVENGASPTKIRMFSGLTATDGSFLMAREPVDDFDWSQVKGKKILGWREGSAPALFLREALTKNGIDPDTDVTIITNIVPAARIGAFMAGAADYGTFFEPDVSIMQATKGYMPLTNIGTAVGAVDYTVFVATRKYIEENPQIIQGFTNAIAQAQDWISTATPDQAATVLAPFFPGVDAQVLKDSFERHRQAGVWKTTPAITPEAVDALQDMLVAGGLMQQDQRQPYESLVVETFAQQVPQQ